MLSWAGLGGFGWHMRFNDGLTPASLSIQRVQVPHDTTLVLSIAYPTVVTSVSVVARVPAWCDQWANAGRKCSETFGAVTSVAAVRASLGNKYHFGDGVLTIRVVTPPDDRTGSPRWKVVADAAPPFVREGVRIPRYSYNPWLQIDVECPRDASDANMCAGEASAAEPAPCSDGYEQTAYDVCCQVGGSRCVDADGKTA